MTTAVLMALGANFLLGLAIITRTDPTAPASAREATFGVLALFLMGAAVCGCRGLWVPRSVWR